MTTGYILKKICACAIVVIDSPRTRSCCRVASNVTRSLYMSRLKGGVLFIRA